MPGGDETIRLIVDMGQSASNVERVRGKLDDLSGSAKQAAETYEVLTTVVAKGTTAMASYAIATDKADVAIDKLVADAVEQARAQKAMNEVLRETATAAERAAGDKRAGGRGVLGLSYAFQDFTGVLSAGGGLGQAMGAIANNIDQIATAAGATAKQAGAMSIAFTGLTLALPVLIPLVKDLWKALAGAEGGEGPRVVVDALDAARERVEGIRKELEKIMAMRPPEEAETKRGFEEGIEMMGGGKALLAALSQAMVAAGRVQLTPAEEEKIAAARQKGQIAGIGGVTDEQIRKIEAAVKPGPGAREEIRQQIINAIAVDRAGELLGRLPTEAGARDIARALARRVPGAFPRGFAERMAELEPEARRRAEMEDVADEQEQGELEGRHRRQAAERRAAAKARRDAEAAGRKADADTQRAEAQAARRVEGGQRLGRLVGTAAARGERPAAGQPAPRPMRLLGGEPTAHEQMQAIAENQAQMADNQRALAELNREIQRARRKNRTTVEFLNQPGINQGR